MRSKICPSEYRQYLQPLIIVIALSAPPRSLAAEQSSGVPAWLTAHVGEGEGQIAQPVLQRARALYLQKLSEGAVRNPCYFAMDATRPNDPSAGKSGGRFYVICESNRSFHAISAGHGSGRDLKGAADFANGRQCAKNFGNAMDSDLTAGGAYVTGETKTSFKGYYRVSANQDAAFLRTFIQFDGEGETANARQRAIGGHAAAVLKGVCLRKRSRQPLRKPRRLRSVWKVGGLHRRPQRRLHQLVAIGRPANPFDGDERSDDAVHLSRCSRRQCRRASGGGRPVAAARRIILERLLFEGNPLSEILAKGNPRADHRPIQQGSSGTVATANADLRGAVKFVSCCLPHVLPVSLPGLQEGRAAAVT